MKILLPALMLGMFSLYTLQARAEESCEQLQKELEANKRDVLKRIKLKKKLKHCQQTILPVTQGTGTPSHAFQPSPAQTTPPPPTQPSLPVSAQTMAPSSARPCGQEFQQVLAAASRLPATTEFNPDTLYKNAFAAIYEQRTVFSTPKPPRTIGDPIGIRNEPNACYDWHPKQKALARVSRDVYYAVPSWLRLGGQLTQQRTDYFTQLQHFSLCALRHVCATNGIKDANQLTWDSGRPAPVPVDNVRPPGHIPQGGMGGFTRPGVDLEQARRERLERERQLREMQKQREEANRRAQAERAAREQAARDAARRNQGGGYTPPRPVARRDMYGALAIDYAQGRAYGWAINARTQDEANRAALSHCNGTTSGQCTVVMQFRNTCATYAVDNANRSTAYGWAWGPNQSNVDATALNYCRQRGGPSSQCFKRVWGCTSH